MPKYVIAHLPTKTYFPISERGKLRDKIPVSAPFTGPPRVFVTEAHAQNVMRWWKGRLEKLGHVKKRRTFFDELQIMEIEFYPVRSAKYLGLRTNQPHQ